MTTSNWLSEGEACVLLGYRSAARFRRNVKDRKIEINYRSTNGRKFQYDLRSIQKFQKETSFARMEEPV